MASLDVASIPVVLLCGGKGTRIRDVSAELPKPMVPIGNFPIVWHIMNIYSRQGFRRFILCLGYKSEAFKQFFLNYKAMTNDFTLDLGHPDSIKFHRAPNGREDMEWSVTLADTGLETMTGGRIARVAKYIDTEFFMCTYGDGLADIDLKGLLKQHQESSKAVTLTGVRPPSRFGELVVEGASVKEFSEKPQVSEGFINGGFMCMRKEFISRYLKDDPGLILEREPLVGAAKDGQLGMFTHKGFWQPMDTHREYIMLNEMWDSGKAPWVV